jgi:8-oxo-dGTP diphosphatase / 2-hydroxy-dATP diphosphatase
MKKKNLSTCTLCIVHQKDKILLGMKKKRLGVGNWNGFGGHVEAGETIEEAAKREVFEEAKIRVSDVEKLGIVRFKYDINTYPDDMEVHIFKAINFTGTPKETDEMKPKWFSIKKIPFKKMWPDDKFWMPMFLKNQKFKGKFVFDKDNKIVNYNLIKL